MKKLLLVVFLLPFFEVLSQDNHSYVGAEVCGRCHKSEKQGQQLSIWQDSKHSKAYETLKTEKADQIASEKGYTTKAIETEDCLKCHAVGYNLDASLLDKKFMIEDGVQCESCHGPGSDYKSNKVMKDKDQAIANGLMVYENPADLCTSCHNEESPTFTKFVFEEMWEKIKHSIPQ